MEVLMQHILWPLLKIVILLGVVSFFVAYGVWLERRLLGFFQARVGPNRVGPAGLLQPIADGVKLFLKEDTVPANARPILFRLAPVFAVAPAFLGFAIITWARPWVTGEGNHPFVISNINLGILFVLAISSLSVFGIILGGWSSGSKYPLLGSLRSTSQMLSYEIPLTLSVLSVILFAGSFKLSDIVAAQQRDGVYFLIPGILAFGVYLIASVAETNRLPFDLPEAEGELTAGFHTEYSGMRFAFYMLGEYTNIILISVIGASLFLGGYDIPFVNDQALYAVHPHLTSILGLIAFGVKAFLFFYFFVWIRATFPRYRYDQLLRIGWKVLLPIALFNLFLAAVLRMWILR
ncbi:MAG: NADH-quinone oxidoreductase subunit NuoH [Acidobacteriota bacterium]|jgi:NADH-quinone oxidoreductase subunit H